MIKMNPLYIIGGLVYVAIGIWTFDWVGRKEGYEKGEMMLEFITCIIVWWFVLFIRVDEWKVKVPERYRVRKKK